MAIADTLPGEDGPPLTVCPECGEAYWDASITHCESDGAYLVGAAEGQTRVDRTVGGRYRLLGKLGEGGMGTVYVAEHALSNRRVALKIIRPELESSALARNRFLRECETLERIKSPHVVEVLESGSFAAGEIYLAMELLEGTPLGERIDSGPIPFREAARIASHVTSALASAHAQGIVHRDLKPDNVFLCEDGTVKVLDFGIARLIDGDEVEGGARRKLTRTGSIVGTPAYMSPEGAAGEPAGPAADLYALGIILFEMLSGELPFDDANPVLLMGRHITQPAPPLPVAVPDALARLVAQMLEKDPKARPDGAAEVGRTLSAVASGEVYDAFVTDVAERTMAPRPRPRAWLLALVALLASGLMLAGVAVVWMIASTPSADERVHRSTAAPSLVEAPAEMPEPAVLATALQESPAPTPPEVAPPEEPQLARPRPTRANRHAVRRPQKRTVTDIDTRW